MTAMLDVIVFARYPQAGRCKTRLIPALGADAAADLHRRLVERTLARLAPLSIGIAYTGAEEAAFRAWLGDAVLMMPQPEGDLGARLLAAQGDGPTVIVGSDIPDIAAEDILAAREALNGHDLVIGRAEDGGFWLIGLKHPRRQPPEFFRNVRWSTAHALADSRKTLPGYRVVDCATLHDVDTADDLPMTRP